MAQLLAQSIQELVSVPAARRAREGEEFLTAGQRVGAGVRVLRGVGGAFQADIRVGVHTALVVDLVYRSGEGFLPGQGQARLPVACKDRWLLSTWCQCRCVTVTLQTFTLRISDCYIFLQDVCVMFLLP